MSAKSNVQKQLESEIENMIAELKDGEEQLNELKVKIGILEFSQKEKAVYIEKLESILNGKTKNEEIV